MNATECTVGLLKPRKTIQRGLAKHQNILVENAPQFWKKPGENPGFPSGLLLHDFNEIINQCVIPCRGYMVRW